MLTARPLDPVAFAPFGSVVRRPAPTDGTEIAAVGPGENRRSQALLRLGWFVVPGTAWPVTLRVMERHSFSSQSFVPCDAGAWLVVVAPGGAAPDMTRAAAFVAGPIDAITLRPNVWHHPLTAIGGPAGFVVTTYLVGDAEDEQFVELEQPVTVIQGIADDARDLR